MPPPRDGPASAALLAALRRTRTPEPQLTQAIAAVCRTDRRFAADVAHVLLARAAGRAAQELLATLPQELHCEAEQQLRFGDRAPGGRSRRSMSDRIDLLFTSADARWRLLVELKLGSGFQADQLTWYRRAHFDGLADAGLVAVVRHRIGEEEPTGERAVIEWCGAVRWSEVFDDLRALRPADPVLAAEWPLLWDVLRDGRELGVFADDLAQMTDATGPILRLLAEDLQPALTDHLEQAVAAHYTNRAGGSAAVGIYGRHGSVVSGRTNATLRFWVGRQARKGKRDAVVELRLWTTATAARRRQVAVTGIVWPLVGEYAIRPRRSAARVREALEGKGWSTITGSGVWGWSREAPAARPTDPALAAAILDCATTMFDELASSGAFDEEPDLRPRLASGQ